MWQRAVVEPIRNAFAVNTLLTQARNHLRNIQHGTFGPGFDDFHETVALIKTFNADFAGLTGGVVQDIADLDFELLCVGPARVVFDDSQMDPVSELADLIHFRRNHLQHALGGFSVGNQITHAHTVSTCLHVLGNHLLQIVDIIRAGHVAKVVADAIQNALGARRKDTLVGLSANVFAVVDLKNIVGNVRVLGVVEELGLVLQRNRRRNLRQNVEIGDFLFVSELFHVDIGVTHQNVHGLAGREIDPLTRELVRPQHGVLENSDDGRIARGTDDLVRDGRQVSQLGFRQLALRHVHIHLIAVEIRIVWLGVANVHAKRVAALHDFDDVTHHTHSMQTWLTVEQDRVAVHHVAMNDVAIFQTDRGAVHVAERDIRPVFLLQNLGTGIDFGPVLHKFHEEFAIPVVDHHGFCETHGDAQGYAELARGQIGVTGDDGSSTEIDTFAHQIASYAAVFRIQTPCDALKGAPSSVGNRDSALDFVVDNHCDKILENHGQIVDDMLRRVGIDSFHQILVGLDDVAVNVSQIVLAALVGVHFDGGSHCRRRDWQHLANHPIRTGPSSTKSHKFHVFI